MNKISVKLILIVFVLGVASACNAPKPKNEGWIQLFNGKDLKDWNIKISGFTLNENYGNTFRVEDGLLKVRYDQYQKFDDHFGHIFYKCAYSHYKIRVEYRFVGEQCPGGASWAYRNNGIMIHGQSAESMELNQNFPVSIEVQLLGSTDSVKQTTANFCTPGTTVYYKDQPTNEHCISSNSKYFFDGEWVNLDIIVEGGKAITNIVNGDTVLVCSKPQIGGYLLPKNYPLPEGTLLEDGYIALQSEGQPLEFRRVDLKILDKKVRNGQERKAKK